MHEKILLIDDEEMILDSLSAILTREGYVVHCVRNGKDALDVLKEQSFDLVITDIRMPGMNGLEVVERVRGSLPDQKIMIITGYGSLETAVKAQHRGVCDYLIKPIDVKGLKNSIRRALKTGPDTVASGAPDLGEKLKDLTEYFTLISDFTQSLNASLDLKEVLEITLDRLKKISETDTASLYLFPRVMYELYYIKNIEDVPVLSVGNGIAPALAEAGQSINEPLSLEVGLDSSATAGTSIGDPRAALIRKAMENIGVKRAFLIPINVKGRILGLADVCRKTNEPFTDTDRNLLLTVTNQAALAVARAFNYIEMKERSKEIELLYSLSLRLNQSLKITDSIKAICEGAVDITGASGSLLQTCLEPGSIKNFIFHRDLGFHKEMKRGSQDWLIPQTARKEAFYSNDPVMDHRVNSLALYSLGIKSLAYVPLIYEWEDLGGLTVFHKTEGKTFDQRDLLLLHLFARHASEVLLNAQLFESVKRSRERIITEKNKMDIILGAMADGVLTIDTANRITYVNDAMLAMLRTEEKDVVGKSCEEIFSAFRCEGTCPAKDNASHAATHIFLETTLQPPGREPMAVYVSIAPIKDAQGKVNGWVKVVRNIDKIKEVEKLKDSFFHALAHDLKAPLTSLMGFMDLLGQDESLSEKQRHHLNIMHESASSMQSIIENLLDVYRSKNASLKVNEQEVDVGGLVSATVREMEGMARIKGVELEGAIGGDTVKVKADSKLIRRVLSNLLSNAIKNTPGGGRVRVGFRRVRNHITDTMDASPDWVEISVEDTGIGIPREDIEKIFDRFYTTSASAGIGASGTGLGLAITKEIVEAHGGRLWAESAAEGGTKFKFTIPMRSD